ncbi:MAG: agmatinase [Syntrophorhabdaceae bacterium]|nr:agmatinase [Syntrophorhabdaceae bacterium]
MNGVFHKEYIGAKSNGVLPSIILLGCPLDITSSFRGGTKFAPESIRRASWTLETYSPYQKRDLSDIRFTDVGDIELPSGNLHGSLEIIEGTIKKMVEGNTKFLIFGGEHLTTYPIVKAVKKHFPDLQLVHFDAHLDLRDVYEGERLSHATVIKRVKELGVENIFQIGIRSGTKEEFEEAHLFDSPSMLKEKLKGDVPLYITFDLDVFDPSLAPGVTTPEPGGLTFKEVMEFFSVLREKNIIGGDIVELSPDYDPTFVSSICAAKVAREMIMLLTTKGEKG